MSYRERQTRKGRRAKTPAQLRRAGAHWVTWPPPGLGWLRGFTAEIPAAWAWPVVASTTAEVGRAMLGRPERPADPGPPRDPSITGG